MAKNGKKGPKKLEYQKKKSCGQPCTCNTYIAKFEPFLMQKYCRVGQKPSKKPLVLQGLEYNRSKDAKFHADDLYERIVFKYEQNARN